MPVAHALKGPVLTPLAVQVLTRTPELRHLDLSTSAFAMPTLWKVLNRLFLPHLETLALKVCRLVFEDAHSTHDDAAPVPIPQAVARQDPADDGGTHPAPTRRHTALSFATGGLAE